MRCRHARYDDDRGPGTFISSTPYKIQYANAAVDEVRVMRKFDQRKVVEGIEHHLAHQPELTSKSRIKAMRQPFWSQYRLRVDEFRVCHDVNKEGRIVSVLRVLAKGTEQTPEDQP